MQTLHVDADTWMHRLSPRAKLLALAALGLLLFLAQSIQVLACANFVGAALYLRSGLPVAEALKRLRPILVSIAVLAIFAAIVGPLHAAIVTALRLTALALFAATVTATTSMAAFIDEITALAMPLETLGLLKAADIGLAIGLVIRFVPEILDRYRAIREAHQARGIKVRLATTLAPLIILTLRDADNIAAAIDARGIRRQ
ncbi:MULTISPECIES: energy-coupling factor transporter transmembrane component T family protein [Rhizobium]|uniref:Biotin transport system permease protein n=1 Tax=Rhizobium tropici TaxID=398 RepID=A0A6P1CCZ9_RHITR|nr:MULTISPECIES: energy-coupling factor transporter transmembrane protein EcfT [Rhizobium]AGB70301.1 biotin ABC transporter, permease protein BioN [Rhizobium tropici CIAT 899]MBB4239301.1 biotin transport system permease protein [Rhizobium tropici]MBB5590571.1 biotin transport system permease protein [Rhizobium tropici]MBB6490220.1 biotin transport system permease protein [Rhizobium tropici]NEV14236.1 energy-coupling factor transporter transmembrane protein EcfT [Rhizobium tropici]